MIAYGTCALPDGRTVDVIEHGTYECDTNAWVPSDEGMVVTEQTSGEELRLDVLNQRFIFDGKSWYLHEWIAEHTSWQMDYEED